MSGHSKWATIKHKKANIDAKRGKLFSKLIKEITVAAKIGGDDLQSNPRLKMVIAKAKDANMPSKNIDMAIKRGIGNLDGINYEEILYEGYGPFGVALLIYCLTDNRNRTVSEVRSTLAKNGGNLGESGSVAWQFEKKGLIYIKKNAVSETEIMDLSIEIDADDVKISNEGYIIECNSEEVDDVKQKIKDKSILIETSEIAMLAKNNIILNHEQFETIQSLLDKLDDLDDVQSFYSNGELQNN